jgi:hypothetical protein
MSSMFDKAFNLTALIYMVLVVICLLAATVVFVGCAAAMIGSA